MATQGLPLEKENIFLSLPFAADVHIQALLFVPHMPYQIQQWAGFSFPKPILACLASMSTFPLGHTYLLPLLIFFLYIFKSGDPLS